MNLDTGLWHCFGCKRGGSIVTLSADLLGISPAVVKRFLRQAYGGGWHEPEGSTLSHIRGIIEGDEAAPEPCLTALPDNHLHQFIETLDPAYNYMATRGFSQDDCDQWQLGWDKERSRVTIPIFQEGKLVGVKGRATRPDQKVKYLVLPPTYPVGLVVFGLDQSIKGGDVLVLEGELDVMAAISHHGVPAAVAIGSNITPHQADTIVDNWDRAIVMFDSDAAGIIGTDKVVSALQTRMPTLVCPEHTGDPASMETPGFRAVVDQARTALKLSLPQA
jgi:DNA primase